MPFNGAGMFVRVRNWVADAAAGVKIRADYHDIEDDGFADGLSYCITKDGQTTIMQDIPMNSKRIVALQDPTNSQDAATKAYADLKLPLAGGTITGNLDVTGSVAALGYKMRPGVSGALSANLFNFNWGGSYVEVWVNATNVGNLASTAYVENRAEAWAAQYAAPKVNRAGDTITGALQVNGELIVAATYLRFNYSGSPGYLLWNGGGSYTLGGGGVIWHNGNLPGPITNARLVGGGGNLANGATYGAAGGIQVVTSLTYCYLQLLTPSGWFTVA